MTAAPIFHVTDAATWDAAQAAGRLAPPDLARDGFVHCATAAQLAGVLARYFAGRTDLVVLELDVAGLGDRLRFEPPQDPHTGRVDATNPERFPHVYGPIPLDVVRTVRPTHS